MIPQYQSSTQILSLYIGKQSQQCAFQLYNLQAEQIFNEQQDPLCQSSIWRTARNQSVSPKLQPRMLIFDTEIERLAAVREVNNRKILKNMKKEEGWASIMGGFGGFQGMGVLNGTSVGHGKEEDDDRLWEEFNNWNDREQHYFKIDKAYTSIPQTQKLLQSTPIPKPSTSQSQPQSVSAGTISPDLQSRKFSTFQQFYRINSEQTQNRIRRELECTDFLKVFTLCSDEGYLGYTAGIVEYLREECEKKVYVMNIMSGGGMEVVGLAAMYDQLDIIIPTDLSITYPYFLPTSPTSTTTTHRSLAPYLSSLLTPFALKDADPYGYVASIVSENRKLFNSCFTLPIIDEKLELDCRTNVMRFQEAAFRAVEGGKGKEYVEGKVDNKEIEKNKSKDKKQLQQQLKKAQLRLNFSNKSYLSLYPNPTSTSSQIPHRYISQSYILKGHFNNLQSMYHPKSQPSCLSLKHLQGIFAMPELPITSYESFYQPEYGQIVQAFPFQTVMFSHEIFGEGIRAGLRRLGKTKLFSEDWDEVSEKIRSVGDLYLEETQDSD